MLRTLGYACAILAVGTIAIAWTGKAGPGRTETTWIGPEQFHATKASLPVQESVDLTFVFTDQD